MRPLLPIFGAMQVRRDLTIPAKFPQPIGLRVPRAGLVDYEAAKKNLSRRSKNGLFSERAAKSLRSGISPAKTVSHKVPLVH